MDVFYAYESSSSLFWVIFSMLSVIIGAVWLNGIAGSVADLWLVLLGLAHMSLVWMSLRFVLNI